MRQLAGEQSLANISDVILTSHRVRLTSQAVGSNEVISIMLDELASCGLTRTSKPIFLILAGISALFGIYLASGFGGNAVSTLSLMLVAAFVILYFATRRQELGLASAGDAIRVQTQGIRADAVVEFIDAVEEAKNARYLLRSTA
ncbi:MAG TPA: hypothetical protein VFQ77_02080 [Pseudonocardiaceae bacterium]|jgi:hypothetical protein|nr:hypothetical protein [Pseudonocardiaceae bacterium]